MEVPQLKSNTNKVQLANKTEGVQATHSYSQDELDAFCEHVNFYLADDEHCKDYVPITDHSKLFEVVGDGILLCKMINKAQPGTIDIRAINLKKPLNIFKKQENLNLAITSAKSLGCKLVNITPQLIMDQREHIILGLTWQVIKAQMIDQIDLKNHPFLIRLKQEDEELEELLKLRKDVLLLRWINYHLKNAGSEQVVKNFDSDLQDGKVYTQLLNQLDQQKCDLSAMESEQNTRNTKVIDDACKLGVPKCIKPSDISNKSSKLNQLFLAHIFNQCPGLEAQEQEIKEVEAATLIDDDNADQSREERVFTQWINSLGIDDVFIQSLIPDLKDGIILNKVMEHMIPGTVNVAKLSKSNKRIFQIQNANLVVENAKKLGASIVGIGGTDIVDGNKKLVLAIVWQLMKKDTLDKLGKIDEKQLLEWCNSRVGDELAVKTLKDKSLANSQYFLQLSDKISPQIVDWDFVQKGDSEQDIMNNAKYAISVARKMGATVCLVWEHIRDVSPKFLLTFLASIKSVAK